MTPDETIKKKLPKSASVFTAELLPVLSALRFIFLVGPLLIVIPYSRIQ